MYTFAWLVWPYHDSFFGPHCIILDVPALIVVYTISLTGMLSCGGGASGVDMDTSGGKLHMYCVHVLVHEV